MPRKSIAIIAVAALALGAGAGLAKGRKADEVPAARNTGPAVSCVSVTRLRDSHIRNDSTIDFMSMGNKGWRVTLPHSCPGLKSEGKFSYETSLSELCSTDIIHVLHDYGGRLEKGVGCGMGKFQPIELVK